MSNINKILKSATGKNAVWWMNFIGTEISKCAKPIEGTDGLQTCNPIVWVSVVVKELWKELLPRIPGPADENIAHARVLSLILTLWTCRIIRAKSYDPRRDPKDRKRIMKRGELYHHALLECIADESNDSKYFPAQEWDYPFSRKVRHEPDEMEKKRQAYVKKGSKK